MIWQEEKPMMYYRTGLGPDTDKVNSLVVPRACLRDVLCAWVIPWAPTMARQAPVATLSIPTADLPILGPPANQTFPWNSRTGNAQFPQLPRPASGAQAFSFPAGSWTGDSGPMTISPTSSSLQLPRISWGFPQLQRPVCGFFGADTPAP